MADLNERDTKLVQYLSEAYGKERELETSLQAHIAMTTRAPYKKRLQQHLRETKAHAKALERRIKKLGGGGQSTQTLVGKAKAAAKGPLHMVRGAGEQEKMLKNAKTIRREEERMAKFLAGQIKALSGAVVAEEVPRGQRNGASPSRPRSSAKRTSAKRTTAKRSSAKRSVIAKRARKPARAGRR
jgi:hypothetical protein